MEISCMFMNVNLRTFLLGFNSLTFAQVYKDRRYDENLFDDIILILHQI